ncbi:RNA polymerase sigma-70 factor [Chitinophaga sp. 212800010-3]|uniref:RNA polymerase sigma factor n=1 Tax=unclassified Chitinophaga TaxID=2619133 RepID=UPI002DED4030|nr:RNA polymerase sigma-70 factor [Chitinophaga sp. 212800010-3]
MNTPEWSDEELVAALKQGDRQAFEEIYNRYASRLFLSAFNILRDRDRCKDLVQEVLVQLWIRREETTILLLRNYLLTAVRYQVLKALRSDSKRVIIEEGEMETLMGVLPLKDHLEESDINRLLDEGIAALPEKCRQIFVMSRKEFLSNKEIAERLGISIKTVENQMTIALHRLRVVMGEFLFWACVLTPLWWY